MQSHSTGLRIRTEGAGKERAGKERRMKGIHLDGVALRKLAQRLPISRCPSLKKKKKKIGYIGTRNRSFGKERRDYTWETARERLEGRDRAAGKKREGRRTREALK